jgi:ferrous iron transport protein B
MSGNIKTINSSKVENNQLFDAWHKHHHKTACHHHGGHFNLKNVKEIYLLLGTPNVGKSTFFNKITTATAQVSNIDRLTVEDTIGRYRNNKSIALMDLPGIHNLSHPIDEEKVVGHEIFNEHFNKIINIIGAQSIQRDLLLTLQCIETGMLNTVVINMMDEIYDKAIDCKKLSKYLNGANIVLAQSNRNIGIDKAQNSSIKSKFIDPHVITYSNQIETYIRKLSNVLPNRRVSNRFYALMLLEGNQYIKEQLKQHYPKYYKKVKEVLGNVCLYDEIINAKKLYIEKIIKNSTTIPKDKYVKVAKHKHYKADRFFLNK